MGLARLRAQLALSKPRVKQWQQQLIRQRIDNQRQTLLAANRQKSANSLARMSNRVKSGDPDNLEGQAAALYFRHAFEPALIRGQNRFYNAALNYGYAVVRAAIARDLAGAGLQPALGLFHNNERNPFNLADDLIEPYRPLLDLWILQQYPNEPDRELKPADKGTLVRFLHLDIGNNQNDDLYTVLAHIQQMVQLLTKAMQLSHESQLWLACPPPSRFVPEPANE
ncbi:MAG: type II CRISPR-associated endonuclease Cas1 [Gammaproteobacteria bacterium]|nr:type II CRISPR-associated endonuclease Cas1 [Gammaproteobacteria bacterium]